MASTWLGYPLVVFAISRLIRPRPTRPDTEPSVSVVIATRDDPKSIRRRVRNVLRTQYPRTRLQVVVAVDAGGPHDVSDFSNLAGSADVVGGEPPGGKALTLNTAVARASGDILVFADTRQRFLPETIPALVGAFLDPRVGGASGCLVLRRREKGRSMTDLYWSFERWLRSNESRIHSPVGVTGAVSALRTSLWEPLPRGLILDDVHTPLRIVIEGHRVVFVTEAVALETRRPSAAQEHDRKTRTLTGVLQLCAWLPHVLNPRKNPLFLQFVFHKLMRLLTPFALVLASVVAVWAFVLAAPGLVAPLFLLVGSILVWIGVGVTARSKQIREALIEVVLTQMAVVRATKNGLRGKWDVWS